jgi:hypothetical protein
MLNKPRDVYSNIFTNMTFSTLAGSVWKCPDYIDCLTKLLVWLWVPAIIENINYESNSFDKSMASAGNAAAHFEAGDLICHHCSYLDSTFLIHVVKPSKHHAHRDFELK